MGQQPKRLLESGKERVLLSHATLDGSPRNYEDVENHAFKGFENGN